MRLESQTGHTAVGTTNQSFVVKEVMAGFQWVFPAKYKETQVFITLDCFYHDSK